MIPTTEEILAQLCLLWRIRDEAEPVEPITMGGMDGLAVQLMYPPLFIINAIDLGKKLRVLEHDYETDVVKVLKSPVGLNYMGEEVQHLMNSIEDKIRHENEVAEDVNLGLLQNWCAGVRPSAAELALRVLVDTKVLVCYQLADPNDEKSVYDFYTLAGNEGNHWGLKQFREKKGKKK